MITEKIEKKIQKRIIETEVEGAEVEKLKISGIASDKANFKVSEIITENGSVFYNPQLPYDLQEESLW
jgi:hypothetical protein